MEKSEMPPNEVCTTQQAAEILGISVTSVQQLVEAGVIEAWKTRGGHRRIPLAAVHAYKVTPVSLAQAHATAPVLAVQQGGGVQMAGGKTLSILIVEDNKMQRKIYDKQISAWNLDVTLTFCENGFQALIEIASHRPDIVLADIVMEGIDGYEVIKTIVGHRNLADINIAIISSLKIEDLEARGGIPAGVVFFGKPVNYDELRGYLRACCAQKARDQRLSA
jgi:excisionase family DNA binding protein